MNEIETAVSVLAAGTRPLLGVGPLLMRTLSVHVFAALVLSCSAIVLMLTHAPWAALLTLSVGVVLLLAYRRSVRRAASLYIDARDGRSG